MKLDREIISNIKDLKDISVMRLANESGIAQANLSRWFKSQRGGYVKEEKIERMCKYLGVDYQAGKLLPGIHRWYGAILETQEIFIKTVTALCPGGGEFFLLKIFTTSLSRDFREAKIMASLKNFFETYPSQYSSQSFQELEKLGVDADAVAVPKSINLLVSVPYDHSFRIISGLYIDAINNTVADIQKELEKIKSHWKFKSGPTGKPLELEFEQGVYERVMDEKLTIEELDSYLSVNLEWTWEKLISLLKERGFTPEMAARMLDLETQVQKRPAVASKKTRTPVKRK